MGWSASSPAWLVRKQLAATRMKSPTFGIRATEERRHNISPSVCQ
jgi:hypothetical protein